MIGWETGNYEGDISNILAFAESVVLLNKLESPENTAVSGQKKKKKNKDAAEEKKDKEAGSR